MKPIRRFRAWLRRDRFDAVQPLSMRVAAFFDPMFTANQMTLVGLALCFPAWAFYSEGWMVCGTIAMTLSLSTDWFDGAIGRFQEEKYRASIGLSPMSLEEEKCVSIEGLILFRGVTHLGRSLDPFVDKIRLLVFLLTIGQEVISTLLIWLIVGTGVLLTIIRPIKTWLKVDDASANRFGKFKIFVEMGGMSALVFLSPWPQWSWYKPLVNLCFILAFLFGLASLFGHFTTASSTVWKRWRAGRLLP